MESSSHNSETRRVFWWILGIVGAFVPIIVIGLIKLWTMGQGQIDMTQTQSHNRLEAFVERYILEHNDRHRQDLIAQKERDAEQEQHFRTTDARVENIRDEQNRRTSQVARIQELEKMIHELQSRVQRLEDRLTGATR